MEDSTHYQIGSPSPMPQPSESTPRWVWAVLVLATAIIGAAIFFVERYSREIYPIQQGMAQELTSKLSGIKERRQIREEKFISGEIKGTTKDPLVFLLANAASPTGTYRVLLSPQTKLYRLSNDTIPKKIGLTIDDFSPGSFVTVMTNEEIGKKDMIEALEVIKLR